MSHEKRLIEYVAVDDLIFDPDNPRLPDAVTESENEGQVIDWMLSDASIIELMGSIGEKGFFPAEPLLVVKTKKTPIKYIVVEGNRRLTAAKLLRNPKLAKRKSNSVLEIHHEAKHKPTELPVIKFAKREQILDYLGFKHITGVRPWSALAKAKYLNQLRKQYSDLNVHDQYKHLAKAIGSRSDYVKELLIGLDIYNHIHDSQYFNIPNLNEETIDFGVYYNALKFANIPKFIGVDKGSTNPTKKIKTGALEELTKWLSEKDDKGQTRLGESRNLSKLNSVVEKPRALELFRKGRSLEDAIMFTDEPDKLFRNAVIEALEQIKEAHSNLHLVPKPAQADMDNVKSIIGLTEEMAMSIEKKLRSSGKRK